MILAAVALLFLGLFLIGRYVYNKTRQQHAEKQYAEATHAQIQQKTKTIPHQKFKKDAHNVNIMEIANEDKSKHMEDDVFEE